MEGFASCGKIARDEPVPANAAHQDPDLIAIAMPWSVEASVPARMPSR